MIKILFSFPRWLRIILSVAYLTCIIVMSLLPPDDFPEIPLFPGADKIVHTCMYLGLAWLSCWSMNAEMKQIWYLRIILFTIGLGVMMEISQLMMNVGRSFDLYDIVGNVVGTLTGTLIYLLMSRMKRRVDVKGEGIRN